MGYPVISGAAPSGTIARLVTAALLAMLVSACTPPMKRVETAYGDGRYLEVAEDLAHSESELSRLSIDQRARYGVYRGLSLIKLGEYAEAHRWLQYAYDVEKHRPTLEPHQRHALDQGWASLRARGTPTTASPASAPAVHMAVPSDGEGGTVHGIRSSQPLAPAK